MDLSIAALLTQDGITNGAIYALLALALVLVFTVTRVIWVPSGEFVAFGTLTLAGLQLGRTPGTVGLLVAMAVVAGVMEVVSCLRRGEAKRIPRQLLLWAGAPLLVAGAVALLAPRSMPLAVQVAATLAAVTALGPLLYRIAYQPLAEASVLPSGQKTKALTQERCPSSRPISSSCVPAERNCSLVTKRRSTLPVTGPCVLSTNASSASRNGVNHMPS